MNIEAAKQLIKKYTAGHATFIARAMTAKRYYLVNNDILYAPRKQKQEVKFDYPLNLHISQTSNLINGLSFRVDKFKRC